MKLLKFTYKKVMSTNDVAIRKIRSGIEQGIIITNDQKKGIKNMTAEFGIFFLVLTIKFLFYLLNMKAVYSTK